MSPTHQLARRRPLCSGAFASVFVLLACGGEAEEFALPESSGPGRILYLTYCASCHGLEGLGNGPVADSLRQAPADLTQLWRRHGVPLEREALIDIIDGRRLVATHGPREMPVWGRLFFEDSPPSTPNLEFVKRRTIEVLVEYLQSIQSRQGT